MNKNHQTFLLATLLVVEICFLSGCRTKEFVLYEFSNDLKQPRILGGPILESMHLLLKGDSMYIDYLRSYNSNDFLAVYRIIDNEDDIWTYSLDKYESHAKMLFDMDTVWVEFHRDSLLLWLPGNTFCKDKDRFWLYRDRD